MKIYVDEMPENCYGCSMCGKFKAPAQQPEIECTKCNLAKRFETRSGFCILKDLRGHDKKVKVEERKKVCEEFKQLFQQKCEGKYWFNQLTQSGEVVYRIKDSDFFKILAQIEKGENNE